MRHLSLSDFCCERHLAQCVWHWCHQKTWRDLDSWEHKHDHSVRVVTVVLAKIDWSHGCGSSSSMTADLAGSRMGVLLLVGHSATDLTRHVCAQKTILKCHPNETHNHSQNSMPLFSKTNKTSTRPNRKGNASPAALSPCHLHCLQQKQKGAVWQQQSSIESPQAEGSWQAKVS